MDDAKRVVVILKNGDEISSERMDDEAAQTEFERILAENPTTIGSRQRLIKLGKAAAFQAGDFARIEVQDSGVLLA